MESKTMETVGIYNAFILSLHSAVALEGIENNKNVQTGYGSQDSSIFTFYWFRIHYGHAIGEIYSKNFPNAQLQSERTTCEPV
jgi:hypothetical protein